MQLGLTFSRSRLCRSPCGKALPFRLTQKYFAAVPPRRSLKRIRTTDGKPEAFRKGGGTGASGLMTGHFICSGKFVPMHHRPFFRVTQASPASPVKPAEKIPLPPGSLTVTLPPPGCLSLSERNAIAFD